MKNMTSEVIDGHAQPDSGVSAKRDSFGEHFKLVSDEFIPLVPHHELDAWLRRARELEAIAREQHTVAQRRAVEAENEATLLSRRLESALSLVRHLENLMAFEPDD